MTPDWQAIVLERIASHARLDQTIDILVQLVETQIAGATGSMLLLDAEKKTLLPASVRGLPAAYNAALSGLPIGPRAGSCGTAAFLGKSVIVTDIETDPLWDNYRDLARAHGLRACWATPILSRRRPGQPTVLGSFALYFRSPNVPTPRDHEVLASAAMLGCIAIETDGAVAELRDSETRFRAFVDHATDAFFIHDADDTRVVDVNQQACISLGFTRDELIGSTPALFDPNGSPTCADLGPRLKAGETVTFESVHQRKDGTTFPVEIRIRTFIAGGRALNLALARDITARRELEERFRQSQKLEAIGRLAGGVAHDFNNLLTVINAQTELLLASCGHDAPLCSELAVIRDAGDRGTALTAQLLAFGRRTIATPKPLDLAALVGRLAQMCKRIIGEQIVLLTDLRSEGATVLADDGLIEQVLMNLVVNARDAMPSGGQLTIATRKVALTGYEALGAKKSARFHLCLSVTDTGEGMTDAVKARMFEPFFTTKPPGKGSGLGLATVYGIVAQADGQIRVHSRQGQGTTIEILLPALDQPEALTPTPGDQQLHGTEVILLVEDEEGVRRVVRRGLERYGYTVLAADNAAAALAVEKAHTGVIDILLTDLVMPGMGGRELAERMRQRRAAIQVIYMSGYTDDALVLEGVMTGNDAFIQKPFTPRALGQKLRAMLSAGCSSASRSGLGG